MLRRHQLARRCSAAGSCRCRRCSWPRRPRSRPGRPARPAGRRGSPASGTAPRTGRPRRCARRARVGGRPDLRQHPARDAEDLQQLVVPVEGLQVHQHGAAGVGHVGDVHAPVDAAGQVPDQPASRCCRRPRRRSRRPRATPSTFSRIHWILPPEKYVASGSPALRRITLAAGRRASSAAGDAVGAGVLPDDRVVVRAAGLPVPHHGRLTLVGDAHGGTARAPDTPASASAA